MPSKDSYGDKPALDYLFHPNSVAVAGVSDDMTKLSGGRIFTETLITAGYKGKLYPLGPAGGEVFGLKIYPSIKDIPDSVDYVISAIPAQYAPQLLLDCATKGVKAVHMFTAGFSEIADEEGKQLESQIAAIAHQKGIRIIGPNCMGLYCPKTGLSYCSDFPRESGSVGYIAQSGGHGLYGVVEATTRGIRFSKAISYGNACDLNESDFLEYLTEDAETRIIAAYIEGITEGHRFLEVLTQAARLKPVIIFKGGATETGARTVSSHTSAIAGSDIIWSSLIQQVGAIQVHSVEELNDVLLLFTYMSPPRGRNIAIIGLGGGASVQAADACSSAGLTVPLLPPEISQRLKDTNVTDAGKMFNNPVDMYSHGSSPLIQNTIKTIANSNQVDLLMMHLSFDHFPLPEVRDVQQYAEAIISLGKEINRRTAVVLHAIALPQSKQIASEIQIALTEAGFPVYPSVSRAANAIAKFVQYYHRQK